MMGSGARRPRAAITYRDNEFIGDMAAWRQANSDDNSEQLARLRRRLLQARPAGTHAPPGPDNLPIL